MNINNFHLYSFNSAVKMSLIIISKRTYHKSLEIVYPHSMSNESQVTIYKQYFKKKKLFIFLQFMNINKFQFYSFNSALKMSLIIISKTTVSQELRNSTSSLYE